jgi:Fic family protein
MLVRTKNDLGQWIKFFLNGIIETSEKAVATLHHILEIKKKIEQEHILKMGRGLPNAMKFLEGLFKDPVVSVSDVQKMTGLSSKGAYNLINTFVEKKILMEITGYQRNRVFTFSEYINCFDESTYTTI